MNIHRVSNLSEYTDHYLGRLLPFLRWWLFMKCGFYNGEDKYKWRRLICWYGKHQFPTYVSEYVQYNTFYIKSTCTRCGYQQNFSIEPYPHINPKNREAIIKELLLGGDHAQAIMAKVYGSDKCDCGQLWKYCRCDYRTK